MRRSIFLFAILIAFTIKAFGITRYITQLGAGALNGTSWENAFPGTSLQTTILASGIGDEVWVAAGTYLTTESTIRTISFSMKNGVAIFGSFEGTESLVSQRILFNGLTSLLSGEIGTASIEDNSYQIISNSNLNNTAIIDGFVIRDAYENRVATLTEGLGGGIYNNASGIGNICSPTIRNCVIINNQAVFGAGIFNNGYNGGNASPIVSHCIIANNFATTGGGGIDNFGVLNGNASPQITNCVIYNNVATQRAGGMYCWGGNNGNASPIVLNTTFANNIALDGGGVVSDRLNASGGSSGNSNPNFRNCIFWGNVASGNGPQFFILGGATFTASYSDIDLTGQSTPHIISGSGIGNINSNPLFENILLGVGTDSSWMTTDDGLQLQNTSPCLNIGDNTGVALFDILSNDRIFNSIVDVGAYESIFVITLPIELISFNAICNVKNVELNWTTASELNNDYFTIERTEDLIEFEIVAFVESDGNSNHLNDYDFEDQDPLIGISYYRLKQTDFNGQFNYSNLVSVNCNGDSEVTFYPNPNTGTFMIKGADQNTSVMILNMLGQIILQTKITGEKTEVDLSDYLDGVYFIYFETGNQKYFQQIIQKIK